MASKGQTAGNPNTPFGVKVYYKPSLGKVVFRKPGVLRRSDRVISINDRVAANPPASKSVSYVSDCVKVCGQAVERVRVVSAERDEERSWIGELF